MTIKGLDAFQRKLKRLGESAQELDGSRISATELLTPLFIQAHTREHGNVQEWFDASPFKIHSPDDLAAVPDPNWDAYVRATTDFSSWADMLGEATKELVERKLR